MSMARMFLPLALLLVLASLGNQRTDDLDEFVQAQMAKRQIPGLSLAIIQDGKIVEVRAYGVIDRGGETPVTSRTLFQVGSISKSVTALAALRLVEQGRLGLDSDINAKLRTWKVPENEYTAANKVTLRGLLSHTAALTVDGFPGYAVDGPIPSLVQVLDGLPPANTAAIRVDTIPGSRWTYSGGGYTVMQMMLMDVMGQPFPELMLETVLSPLEMTHSTYAQPLSLDRAAATATAHYEDRSTVPGRWHVYPEMAAAGLWTTPTDLARFAIEIQRSLAGQANTLISARMARQMLTEQMNHDGLGVFLEGAGQSLRFMHGGRDEGFDARLVAYAETGQGAVIMINANDNGRTLTRIFDFIARKYHWPDAPQLMPLADPVPVTPALLLSYAGRYELFNNYMVTLVPKNDRLYWLVGGMLDEEFVPMGGDSFASSERNVRFTFTQDSAGEITGLTWSEGGEERHAPRIGPLMGSLESRSDPDPPRTIKVEDALRALAQGGQAVEHSPHLTPGARKDFIGGVPNLVTMRDISFVAEQDVADRHLERHESPVARILYYTLVTDTGQRYIMVHLTEDGVITDYDVVDR